MARCECSKPLAIVPETGEPDIMCADCRAELGAYLRSFGPPPPPMPRARDYEAAMADAGRAYLLCEDRP